MKQLTWEIATGDPNECEHKWIWIKPGTYKCVHCGIIDFNDAEID